MVPISDLSYHSVFENTQSNLISTPAGFCKVKNLVGGQIGENRGKSHENGRILKNCRKLHENERILGILWGGGFWILWGGFWDFSVCGGIPPRPPHKGKPWWVGAPGGHFGHFEQFGD